MNFDAPQTSRDSKQPQAALRLVRPSDLAELLRLDARCFPPRIAYSRSELEFFVRHPRSTTIVAELDGQDAPIVGFCVVDWKLQSGVRIGHFITVDVAPERRRAGIGRLLMQAGESELLRAGCLAIALEVADNNKDALAFYERLGYRETGRRIPGYYADGSSALVMRKPLP